jgi:hypothetical protein
MLVESLFTNGSTVYVFSSQSSPLLLARGMLFAVGGERRGGQGAFFALTSSNESCPQPTCRFSEYVLCRRLVGRTICCDL